MTGFLRRQIVRWLWPELLARISAREDARARAAVALNSIAAWTGRIGDLIDAGCADEVAAASIKARRLAEARTAAAEDDATTRRLKRERQEAAHIRELCGLTLDQFREVALVIQMVRRAYKGISTRGLVETIAGVDHD